MDETGMWRMEDDTVFDAARFDWFDLVVCAAIVAKGAARAVYTGFAALDTILMQHANYRRDRENTRATIGFEVEKIVNG